MKVAIIGAGNMGSAIARGLAQGYLVQGHEIVVSNPTNGKLEKLKADFPNIKTTNNNMDAASNADIVIAAVKPCTRTTPFETHTDTRVFSRRYLFRRFSAFLW